MSAWRRLSIRCEKVESGYHGSAERGPTITRSTAFGRARFGRSNAGILQKADLASVLPLSALVEWEHSFQPMRTAELDSPEENGANDY
jgi:hypothetical protein